MKKIALMLTIMVMAVALFAVPAMAADDPNDVGSITTADVEKLVAGETVVKTDSFVDENGELVTVTSEMGAAPTSGIQLYDTGTHNGWFFQKIVYKKSGSDYAYSRVEFKIDSSKTTITEARQAVADAAAGYYPYGQTGGVTVSNISYQLRNGTLFHYATFRYNGIGERATSTTYMSGGQIQEYTALAPA